MKSRKFKWGNPLFVAFLAIAGIFGVSATVIDKQVKEEQVVEKAEATYHVNPTFYFVPHGQWIKDGNERFKMNCYYNGNLSGYIEMTYEGTGASKGLIEGRKVYKGVVTAGWWVDQIQVFRMGPDFYTQYNCSEKFGVPEDIKNCVLMTNYSLDYWNNWTTSTSGVWWNHFGDYSIYKTTDQSLSSSTGRVFFNNSGTHWADNSGTNKGCAVYAWGGSASPKKYTTGNTVFSATVYNLNWFNDDNGMSYGYADIPLDVTGYKFVRITKVDDYTTDLGYFSDTGFIVDSFAHIRFGVVSGNTITSGGAKNDVAGANLMKKVIEAYDTCSSSVLNGYGASDALNTNFYSHATDSAKSATHASFNGSTTTIQNHFEAMAARSTGGSSDAIRNFSPLSLFGEEDNLSTVIIIVASSVALLSVTALSILVIKKRKNKEE